MSYHAGAIAEIRLSSKWALESGLMFSSKGFSTPETQGGGVTIASSRIAYNYLAMPTVIKFHPVSKLSVSTGLEWSYLLSARNVTSDANLFDFWDDIGVDVNKLDIGLVIGSSLAITNKISIDARYIYGLSSVQDLSNLRLDKFEDNFMPQSSRFLNRTFQLSVSYFLKR